MVCLILYRNHSNFESNYIRTAHTVCTDTVLLLSMNVYSQNASNNSLLQDFISKSISYVNPSINNTCQIVIADDLNKYNIFVFNLRTNNFENAVKKAAKEGTEYYNIINNVVNKNIEISPFVEILKWKDFTSLEMYQNNLDIHIFLN